MGAVFVLTRRELRRRWRSLVVLALLVALAGGVTVASLAGARRTGSSFDRFLEWTRSQDVLVLGHGIDAEDVSRIRALPGVEAVGVGRIMALAGPDGDLLGGGAVFAPLDDVLGRDIYRIRIIAGRAPSEGVAEEIALSETLARTTGVGVGDVLPVGSYTQEQLEQLRTGSDVSEPAGPRVSLRVVGISRSPDDLNVQSSDGGVLVLPAAFADTYGDGIGGWYGQGVGLVAIRLDQGGASIESFVEGLDSILDPGTFDVDPVALTRGGVQQSIDLLAMASLLVGVIVGLAGLIAVALTISGQVTLLAGAQAPLRDLGFGRRARAAAVAVPVLLAIGVGAVLATLGAWSMSGLFPLGVARDAEPHPGLAFDALILPVGAAAIVGLVGGIIAVAAWRAVGGASGGGATMPRPSRVTRALEALGVAPPATLGIRMALERGRGRTAVPVGSALVGASLAVVGIAGVVVFGASLDHLLATPAAQGRHWDAAVVDTTARPLDDDHPCAAADTQLLDQPDIEAVAVACSANFTIGGRAMGGIGLTPLRGSTQPTVLAGRAPSAPDEIALGSDTLAALGSDLDDLATVQTPDGPVDYRIVGEVIVPRVVDPQAIADGAVFTGAGFDRIQATATDVTWNLVVRIAADVDKEAELARIAQLPGVGDVFGEPVIASAVPLEVERLDQVNRIPHALAVLLAALGALAVGHLLLTSVRRRRRDLAVLKSLGFSRRQLMATVAWQAVTVAGFGIVVGVTLGVASGTALWRTTAHDAGVEPSASIPILALVAVALATVAVANLVAAVPARHAANVPAAQILRTD